MVSGPAGKDSAQTSQVCDSPPLLPLPNSCRYHHRWTHDRVLQVDEIIEKIYANMSACHLKNQNWKRAQETADKVGLRISSFLFFFLKNSPDGAWSQALAKNENNYKAMFRKGKALGEQGFFEKALKILEDLKTKNPSGMCPVRLGVWDPPWRGTFSTQIRSWSIKKLKDYGLSTMNARKCTNRRWKVPDVCQVYLNPIWLICERVLEQGREEGQYVISLGWWGQRSKAGLYRGNKGVTPSL